MSDELLQYRHFVSKQLFEKDLSDEQEEEVLAQFAALDSEKRGQIEWSDFLYHESLGVLRKFRTEVPKPIKHTHSHTPDSHVPVFISSTEIVNQTPIFQWQLMRP